VGIFLSKTENLNMPIEIPSHSLESVREVLKDRTKLVYLVIAAADSTAWEIALAAEQDLAGVFPVRFQEREDAKEWITDKNIVAAAADWDGRIHTFLSAAQADDKDFVEQKLNRRPA
jgi:hypothetical protein